MLRERGVHQAVRCVPRARPAALPFLALTPPSAAAYTLTRHPIAVHWDMDVAVLRPLDDVYDAMLHPSDHPRGAAARRRLARQHPDDPWPDAVDAFLTRDVTSAQPWETRTAVQGGFLVARPDVGE